MSNSSSDEIDPVKRLPFGKPEKTRLNFGIIPLSDCAVLVMAVTKGFFSRHGLEVSLSREISWANIRDKVQTGLLDGAQMLAPMPIASTLGIGGVKQSMLTAFNMDLNGNGITVSNELYQRMQQADPEAASITPVTAHALKKVIESGSRLGQEPMTFAMVFPFSTHNYQLRYWLAAAGINPDTDLRMAVVPPPRMVENLEARNIDGFCVGEPWNEIAVTKGVGRALVTNYEIWNNCPEKVFGVTRDWAETYPNTHRAVLAALMETAEWLDKDENRMEVVETIATEKYVNVPADIVKMSMTGTFKFSQHEAPRPMADFNVFHRYAANYPWLSHAEWFITQMFRWGQLTRPVDIRRVAGEVYRPDIYAEIAAAMGRPYPLITHKPEGVNRQAWTLTAATQAIAMGADLFIDGKVYDPADPVAYIKSFAVSNLDVDLHALAHLNPPKA